MPADKDEFNDRIAALVEGPMPDRFIGVLETAAVVSAVLIVLQTHVKFERDKEGRYTVLIEKKPTDESLLKGLVKKLLSVL